MKVLLLDIESTPNLGYIWDHYDVNVIKHVKEWEILCVAYMWLDDTKPQILSKPNFGMEEGMMLDTVWNLLNEADVVVAHNGDRFDIRKINARFLYHGMNPTSPYFTVDTLKVARQKFRFNQNGLDPLAKHLGLGRKAKHQGFELWERCMADPTDVGAWATMERYAKKDVVLLKKLYLMLRPWITNHPNMMVDSGGQGCPKCGSAKLQRRGFAHTKTMRYQQWLCMTCGAWSRTRMSEPTEKPEQV